MSRPFARTDSGLRLLTAAPGPFPAISSGSIEALKWLAVVFMTLDHVNLFLLGRAYPWMYDAGRIALPLFAFTLAYGLAQPRALAGGAAVRSLSRLIPAAIVASLPYTELNLSGRGWYPANIMFGLAAAAAIIALVVRPSRLRVAAAVAIFAAGGWLSDYGWTGVGLVLSCWCLCRAPNLPTAAATLACLWWLGRINGNEWALATIPLVGIAYFVGLGVPRIRHALYIYYPLHLAIIAGLRILLI